MLSDDVDTNKYHSFLTAGLERTDNSMELSSWPQIPAINQKNYYTYVSRMLLNLHDIGYNH